MPVSFKIYIKIFLVAAQIEMKGNDFVMNKLNMSSKWPVLKSPAEFDESLWNQTELHRFSVDFFVDSDLKNVSQRILYVSFKAFTSLIKIILIYLFLINRFQLQIWD